MAFIKIATVDCSCIWRLCIVHCVLHIAWLGSAVKLSIFMAMEHHRIKEEAWQALCVVVCEAVYHKSVLCNHHTQCTMFKCKQNWLYLLISSMSCQTFECVDEEVVFCALTCNHNALLEYVFVFQFMLDSNQLKHTLSIPLQIPISVKALKKFVLWMLPVSM